ncbi:hypothetical protein ACFX1Z_039543 [Malus domestica]
MKVNYMSSVQRRTNSVLNFLARYTATEGIRSWEELLCYRDWEKGDWDFPGNYFPILHGGGYPHLRAGQKAIHWSDHIGSGTSRGTIFQGFKRTKRKVLAQTWENVKQESKFSKARPESLLSGLKAKQWHILKVDTNAPYNV